MMQMGTLDETMYTEMFDYVEKQLAGYDVHGGKKRNKIRYSRMDHTRRVYRWMMELYEASENKDQIDIEALRIATIFHDSGYGSIEQGEHAKVGAGICREYLTDIGYPGEKIDFICELIASHSDKKKLVEDISPELMLLMEADLLDDTGAHGVVMDVWIEATGEDVTFESIRDHIARFSLKQTQKNPMRTKAGRRIWEEKCALVKEFYESYSRDLEW